MMQTFAERIGLAVFVMLVTAALVDANVPGTRYTPRCTPADLRKTATAFTKTITEQIETTGEPAAVALSVDKTVLSADHRDVVHFTVSVVDVAGRTAPTADNDITFELTEPGKILSVDNGNLASEESFQANHRKAFNGL